MNARHKNDGFSWAGFFLFVIALGVLLLLYSAIKRDPGNRIAQKAQFHSMEAALEYMNYESGLVPASDANDPTGRPYCGAMKFCEAMMGRDLYGFHPDSIFKQDGTDSNGKKVYSSQQNNLQSRKGPYLPLEAANAFKLSDIYGKDHTCPFPGDLHVLCDTFKYKRPSGKKTGLPILYYLPDPNLATNDPNNIYDYRDNQAILELGVPGKPEVKHPMADPKVFYEMIKAKTKQTQANKNKPYILISAGFDGLYGTEDDVLNFDWKLIRI